jgi:hypothetical protein
VGLAVLLNRWRKPAPAGENLPAAVPMTKAQRDEYDARLDQELKDLDD